MAKKIKTTSVTVALARKVLKLNSKTSSDEQVKNIIALFENLSDMWLDNYEKKVFGKTINQLTE